MTEHFPNFIKTLNTYPRCSTNSKHEECEETCTKTQYSQISYKMIRRKYKKKPTQKHIMCSKTKNNSKLLAENNASKKREGQHL